MQGKFGVLASLFPGFSNLEKDSSIWVPIESPLSVCADTKLPLEFGFTNFRDKTAYTSERDSVMCNH